MTTGNNNQKDGIGDLIKMLTNNLIKLNVGCGSRKIHGFINIDAREDTNPDVVADVRKINEQFKDVDLIYACHVLEHFPNKKSNFQDITWKDVLTNWYTSLKEGGILRIAVPDIEAVIKHYNEYGDLQKLHTFLYGGQKYDFDFHYHCWNYKSLSKDLYDIGFKKVSLYDWKKTEHFYIDDYSQAYLPHMDKANGLLMSLNLEAIK
jgi:predicted SAM-dependent methyltransferase